MDNRSELELLIKLISPKRISNIHMHGLIAECIRNVGFQYYDVWLKTNTNHAKLYDKYKCDEIWRSEKKTNCGLYTLHQMAKCDNPLKYNNAISKIKRILIKMCIDDFEPINISKLVAFIFEHRFKCTSPRLRIWYEFVDHKWIKINTTHILRKIISTEILLEFQQYQSHILNKVNKPKYYIETVSDIENHIIKLNNFMFQIKIIRELANNDKIFDPFFTTKLNDNKYLFGFTNGVFDAEQQIFRDGTPDDYISLTTGYDFVKINSSTILNFFKYENSYTKNKNDITQFFNHCIFGNQTLKLNIIYDNFDTHIPKLLKYLFGDYFEEIDKSYFFKNNNTNYLKRIKYKRICFIHHEYLVDVDPKFFYNFSKKSNLNFDPHFILVTVCDLNNKVMQAIDYVNIIEIDKLEEDISSDKNMRQLASFLMSIIISKYIKK